MNIKELMKRFENIADPEARWTAMSVYADVCDEKGTPSRPVTSASVVQKTMTIKPAAKAAVHRKPYTRRVTPTIVTPTGKGAWDWETAGLVKETIFNRDTGCRFYIASRYKKDGLNFSGMREGFEQKYDMSGVHSRTAHDTIYNGGIAKPTSPFKWIIESSGVSLGRHLHARGLLRY